MITRKKIAISTLEIMLKQVLSILSIVILARLLTPSDYGKVVPIYLIYSITSGLIDFGVGSAVVRFKEIGHEGESTAFWMNIFFAAFLSLLTIMISSSLSVYFNDNDLENYIWFISASLLISAFGAIQQNILLRDKDFTSLFLAGVVPQLFAIISVIWLANLGYGPWALIAQILISSIASSILLWVLSSWRPAFIFRIDVFKKLVGFGFYLTLAGIVNGLYKNASATLVLKGSGASAAGNYYAVDRIQQYISDFIANISSRLSFTSFVGSQEKDTLVGVFSYGYKLIAFISSPLFWGIFAVSDLLVWLVLGEKWMNSSSILKVLAIVGFLWPLELHNQNLIKAVGNLRSYFRLELIKRAFGVAALAATALTMPVLIPYIVAALAITFYLANAWYVGRLVHHGVLRQLRDMLPAFMSGLIMMLTVDAGRMFEYSHKILELSVSICIGIFAYILATFLLNRIMYTQLKETFSLLLNRIYSGKKINAD